MVDANVNVLHVVVRQLGDIAKAARGRFEEEEKRLRALRPQAEIDAETRRANDAARKAEIEAANKAALLAANTAIRNTHKLLTDAGLLPGETTGIAPVKIGDDKVDVLSRLQYVRPTFAGPANAPNVFITIGALYAADSKEIVAIVVTGEASDEPGGAKLVTKILAHGCTVDQIESGISYAINALA